MNNLDQAIRQSLSAEDAALLDRLGADPTLHQLVLGTFQGRLRWFNIAGWVAGVVLFAVGCVLAWQFLQAEDVRDMLRWGAASAFAFSGLSLIKVWFWMELQKNDIVREVKRLELQVASLAAQFRRP
jgi:putative Mn2+ efflux pump MntP